MEVYLRDIKTTKEFDEYFLNSFIKIVINNFRFAINKKLEDRKDYKELHELIYATMKEFEKTI